MEKTEGEKRKSMRDFNYICKTYGVPAKLGGRVIFTGGGQEEKGVITGVRGAHLLISLDGCSPKPYHPTWELKYVL